MEGLISGINSMGNQLAKTMNGVANKMVSGINKGIKGVRSGVNHILKEVDSDKRIKEWNPPKYARGTSRRGHPEDGPAIINDAKGPKYKEIVQKRDGSMWTTDAKNAMAYLNKGDRVINGKLSDRMLNQKHVPHYAKGTDPDEDQDMEEIFDIIDDKKKYKEFLQNKINYDGLNSPWLNMTKSASKMMINEAYDMIQKESEAMMGGSFDGDIWNKGPDTANGVYSYLVKIAKNVIKKFPGMSITSGYRPNDPHHHGKRQAIDIAYGAGLNGSKKYIAPANYAFKKFRDQIAYVIALNKVKDRTGYAGEGKTNSWKPFRGGGHMDHLHLSGLFGPGDVGKGDSESLGGGSGVNRWKKTAMKALRMEGLYSKKNLSLLMMQMKSESNGNPKAINNWDANAKRGTPSKGLMQVIGPTFQSNKRKGYGNIWKPLDNILAAIRYTKKQYGSLSRGWRDSGYENGGLVSKDGLYRMGEKNRKEMVIPLHRAKRSRAMELLEKTKTALGDEEKNVTVVSSGGDMSGVESKLDTLIGLMSALLEKDSNTYLDGRAVEKQLSKVSKQREKMSQRKRGKNVTFA